MVSHFNPNPLIHSTYWTLRMSWPGPAAAKHLQTMTPPPPCFTGLLYLIYTKHILCSGVQMVTFRLICPKTIIPETLVLVYVLMNVTLTLTFALDIQSFLLAHHPGRINLFSFFMIGQTWTLISTFKRTSCRSSENMFFWGGGISDLNIQLSLTVVWLSLACSVFQWFKFLPHREISKWISDCHYKLRRHLVCFIGQMCPGQENQIQEADALFCAGRNMEIWIPSFSVFWRLFQIK